MHSHACTAHSIRWYQTLVKMAVNRVSFPLWPSWSVPDKYSLKLWRRWNLLWFFSFWFSGEFYEHTHSCHTSIFHAISPKSAGQTTRRFQLRQKTEARFKDKNVSHREHLHTHHQRIPIKPQLFTILSNHSKLQETLPLGQSASPTLCLQHLLSQKACPHDRMTCEFDGPDLGTRKK